MRTPLQADLPLVPRRRAALHVDDALQRQPGEPVMATVARREETAEVTLRVPAATAAVYQHSPAAALFALQSGAAAMISDVCDRIGYTDWRAGVPPCSGPYQVRQKSARDGAIGPRVWFDSKTQAWWFDGQPADESVTPVAHSTFTASHLWRGLKAPFPAYTFRVPGQRTRLMVD